MYGTLILMASIYIHYAVAISCFGQYTCNYMYVNNAHAVFITLTMDYFDRNLRKKIIFVNPVYFVTNVT